MKLNFLLKKISPIFFLLILTTTLFYEAIADTPTYDEPANMAASYDYLFRNDYRLYPDNPPLVKLLAGLSLFPIHKNINFPTHLEVYRNPQTFDLYQFGTEFLFRSNNNTQLIILLTRLPNIIFTLSLAVLIYCLAKELYGENAALLSLFLYCLEPNIRGHGHILAFDIPLSFFILLTLYLTFKYLKVSRGALSSKRKVFYIFSISFTFALGFLTKFTMALFTLIYALGILTIGRGKDYRLSYKTIFSLFFSIGAISLGTLWLFGLLTGYGRETLDYNKLPIITSVDQNLYDNLVWKAINTLPVPYYYQAGIKTMYTHNIVSQPAFLWGKVHARNDWFFYFPISFLLKAPLLIICSIFLILFILFKKMFKGEKVSLTSYFPLIIGFSFMFFLMLTSHINNVFRYLFPSYSLFLLSVGQLIGLTKMRLRTKLIGLIGLLYYIATSLLSFPYDLSYTNEITGIPPKGYRYLSDSEVDWGQDLSRLAEWLKKNDLADKKITLSYLGTADPAYYGIKYKPLRFDDLNNLSGIVAISVGNLTLGDWQWTSRWQYQLKLVSAPLDDLRNSKPYATIAKSIFVYRFGE